MAVAEGLNKLGYEVTVVTSSIIERDGRPAWRTRRDYINGVKVTYLGSWLKIKQASLNPAVLPFALSEIAHFNAVYIIGLYDMLGPAVAVGAWRSRVPYIVEPTGMLIPIVRSVGLKRAYHAIFGYAMLKGARAVTVASQLEWHEAAQFGIPLAKLAFCGYGIHPQEYKFLPPRGALRRRFGIAWNTPLILWLGRIEAKKNLEQLIEALAGLKHCNWALVIAGPEESPGYLTNLRRLADEVGIRQRLYLAPGLYDNAKLAAYSDADLFVLVSVNENWGITVAEAIAAGVPVLVTRTCGVAEAVEGRAGLVVECNVSGIRDGLERLLNDTDLYRQFKAGLPSLTSELSWDKPVSQMAELFQSW